MHLERSNRAYFIAGTLVGSQRHQVVKDNIVHDVVDLLCIPASMRSLPRHS